MQIRLGSTSTRNQFTSNKPNRVATYKVNSKPNTVVTFDAVLRNAFIRFDETKSYSSSDYNYMKEKYNG